MKNDDMVPEVGMAATMGYHSDRHAGTVVAVSESGRQVTVRRDRATRTDKNGVSESQTYSFEQDPDGEETVFTLRKDGSWYPKGCPIGSTPRLALGHRSEFYDFSF